MNPLNKQMTLDEGLGKVSLGVGEELTCKLNKDLSQMHIRYQIIHRRCHYLLFIYT